MSRYVCFEVHEIDMSNCSIAAELRNELREQLNVFYRGDCDSFRRGATMFVRALQGQVDYYSLSRAVRDGGSRLTSILQKVRLIHKDQYHDMMIGYIDSLCLSPASVVKAPDQLGAEKG
jgi:hypothetical protein